MATNGSWNPRGAAIVGVYTTEQGDLRKRSTEDLHLECVKGVLEDAGMRKEDIDGMAGGRSPSGSAAGAYPGFWSEQLDVPIRYYSQSDTAAAAHSANILHAAAAINCGLAETVLILAGGSRGTRQQAVQDMAFAHGEFDTSWGSIVPSWFAFVARRHMEVFGTTSEQLAEIAVSTRMWAAMHPQAIMKKSITKEDVVNSRMIADPLHLLDCCLVNDGAGAILMTSAERASDCRQDPVYVLGGAEEYSHRGYVDTHHDFLASGAVHCANKALSMAGVTRDDIDVLEIYDCFTITVMRELEDLGFCKVGEGGQFVETGVLRPGGKLPMNTHGGGLSWGHNFSGMAHAIEATRQLRGECGERQVPGAEVSLVHSQGGPLALHSTVILGRD
jgi:acetyl-CoA acetyltransferase